MTDNVPTDNLETDSEDWPFLVEHERLDQTPQGFFRPGAGVRLTPALRTSGLLLALPAEELKSLLLILTFVTANGWIRPSIQQLSEAMRISDAKVRQRLGRLAGFSWRGAAIVRETEHAGGLHTVSLATTILGVKEISASVPPGEPPVRAAAREEVIDNSRARYARPRSEVEFEIALRQGWPLPGSTSEDVPSFPQAPSEEPSDPARAEVRQRLVGLGVTHTQVDALIRNFDVERIERQIRWLPYRRAKSPARYLVAAIEGNYDEPMPIRLRWGKEKLPPIQNDAPAEAVPLSEAVEGDIDADGIAEPNKTAESPTPLSTNDSL